MVIVTHEVIATKLDIVVKTTIFANSINKINMAVDKNYTELIAYFSSKEYFTKEDFNTYIKDKGFSINNKALLLRIHRLKQKGIIQSVARGKYTISKKPTYSPEPDKFIRKVNKLFLSEYDELDYCTWSTKCLHELMLHIPVQSFYVFETEKDICEATFYLLKDNGVNAYYEPNQEQIDKYILPEKESIIIRHLVSRAPYHTIEKIRMASIEKILVDLYCDSEIYYIYGGSELKRIYENVLRYYTINFSTLFQYVERRKRDKEIRAFILNNFGHIVKNIIS